jgi:hypothetical protein
MFALVAKRAVLVILLLVNSCQQAKRVGQQTHCAGIFGHLRMPEQVSTAQGE